MNIGSMILCGAARMAFLMGVGLDENGWLKKRR